MRINRIGNWAKTTALAGLLATSPIAKAQTHLNQGEKIIAVDTVELFEGQKALALLIDNDGNLNNFEKFAFRIYKKTPINHHSRLKGKKGFNELLSTQYVDTLVKSFKRYEDELTESTIYYVSGPRISSSALITTENDTVYATAPHKLNGRTEIPKALYDEISNFLKSIPKKEEHVVRSLDEFFPY